MKRKMTREAVPPDLPADDRATYNPATSAALQSMDTPETDRAPQSSESSWVASLVASEGETLAAGTTDAVPPVSSRFRVRRKLGEGGHGLVWEAVQTSLGRSIALKSLKTLKPSAPGHPQRSSEEREQLFRQEAALAAALEHPNIIPVHDLGLDDEGHPLLAMKMVRGRQWHDELRVDFYRMREGDFYDKHLQILSSVCQAVAFAHSRGVVHRDIKPAQVMIGDFGEVLLMDWGLAMFIHGNAAGCIEIDDFNQGEPPNPAGTPCYMAPEQTEETCAHIGPWTDVYLLGGVLYEMLTGHAPHAIGESVQAFIHARHGNIRPPEAMGRDMPRELLALARKALEPRPANRLQSAQEFLDGIRDYLTGATNRSESMQLVEQVAKDLATEHEAYRTLADCINALERSLVLWPGNQLAAQLRQETLAGYARMAIAGRDLKLARVQAERLEPGTDRAGLLVEIERLEIEQKNNEQLLAEALAQTKADRERVENLLRFLLGDLYLALKSIGRLDLIHAVARESLTYFDSLEGKESTPDALLNRCIAYLHIGDVLSDQGRKPEAEDTFRHAVGIASDLAAANGDDIRYMTTQADSLDRLGQMLYYQGKTADALERHREALKLRERLLEAEPDSLPVKIGHASTRHRIGIIHWRREELDEALSVQSGALSELEVLSAHAPGDEELSGLIGWTLSTLGNVYRDKGDLAKAIEVTRKGLTMREELSRKQPANSSRLEDVLWTRGNLALLLLMNGDYEESLYLFRKDLPLRRRISQDEPGNVVKLNAVTFPLSLIAETELALGRIAEAEAAISDCVSISEQLMKLDPTSTHVMGNYARHYMQFSEILAARGELPKAAAAAEKSLHTARQAVDASGGNPMPSKILARTLAVNAFLGRATGKPQAQWEPLLEESVAVFSGLNLPPDDIDTIDLQAQHAVLSGNVSETERLFETLRARRWLSPYLQRMHKTI